MARTATHDLRGLLSRLPRQGRLSLLAVAVLSAIERVAVVLVAVAIEREARAVTAAASTGLMALMAIRGLVRSGLVRQSRVALADASVASLFQNEPLESTFDEDFHATIFEGLHYGTNVIAGDLPSLMSGAAAIVPVCVILVGTLPPRLVALGILAIVSASVVVAAVRPAVARLAEESRSSWQAIIEDVATAIDGRIEVVASGLDGEFLADVRDHLKRWTTTAARTGFKAAVLARTPAAMAAIGIAFALLADGDLYYAVASSRWSTALVIAAALPTFIRLATDAIELARGWVRLRPFLAFLACGQRGMPPGPRKAPPPLPALIEWRAVSFSYGRERTEQACPAVDELSITWQPGSVLSLEGPNGSGKSTWLRLLLALGRASSGSIFVGGVDLADIDVTAWRQAIAYLPQRPYLNERATARAAILLIAPQASDAQMMEALERVNLWSTLAARAPLGDPLEVRVGSLSAGERQRLALARVLCRPSSIVLLDEPDANIDAVGIRMIERIVRELSRDHMVAVAAHAPDLLRLGDKRLLLQSEASESRRAG